MFALQCLFYNVAFKCLLTIIEKFAFKVLLLNVHLAMFQYFIMFVKNCFKMVSLKYLI